MREEEERKGSYTSTSAGEIFRFVVLDDGSDDDDDDDGTPNDFGGGEGCGCR